MSTICNNGTNVPEVENGLEIVVNSNVTFTIDEKYLAVTRIHKAQ